VSIACVLYEFPFKLMDSAVTEDVVLQLLEMLFCSY
jgi:hypothetical protein